MFPDAVGGFTAGDLLIENKFLSRIQGGRHDRLNIPLTSAVYHEMKGVQVHCSLHEADSEGVAFLGVFSSDAV